MLAAITLVTACLMAADSPPDLDALARLIDGLQVDLKDVEFAYEGGFGLEADREAGRPPKWTFQGRFAYRSDRSLHVDIYRDFPDPNRPIERTILGFGARELKLETLEFRPDRDQSPPRPKTSRSGVVSLERDDVPLRFWLTPVLLCLLRDTGGYRTANNYSYECLGWEDVDGHRCLKVKFGSKIRSSGQPGVESVYWLDMGRGGTPIRRDEYNRGDLWVRTEGVKLAEFPIAGGRTFWFPVRGKYFSYLTGDATKDGKMETLDRPVVEQTYFVLDGSVAFNRDLPDERFTVRWKAPSEGASLKAIQSEHEKELRRPRKAGPQSRVDEAIEKADDQKVLLEASAPSREWASASTIGMVVLGILGGMLLCSPWIARWIGR